MPREKNPVDRYIDPVCLMPVDPQLNHPTFTYRMRTYHFCADACRSKFEKNPESYFNAEKPRKRNLWQRYLDRLNKATGGKPPSCCH